ncbi:MAG TPA: NAD-dependent epimerase/dehydratase family protein [Dehalococcoidia bacterium]
MTTFAVTGANGFVGSRIAKHLSQHGEVREMTRHSELRFALGEPVPDAALAGVDVLVHCAYDFRPKSWRDIKSANVTGTLALFDAARRAGVQRVIFISSMSAFEGCRSKYGRAKLAIERKAREHHTQTVIVRPGLVYDREAGGIVGAMQGFIGRLPVVPLVGGGQEFYTCHSEDLAQAVLELSDGPLPEQPVIAAEARSRTYREILSTIAEAGGRKPLFLPVPYLLAYSGLKALEALRVPTGFRSDSLVGLMNADPAPQFSPLKTTFRPFSEQAIRG